MEQQKLRTRTAGRNTRSGSLKTRRLTSHRLIVAGLVTFVLFAGAAFAALHRSASREVGVSEAKGYKPKLNPIRSKARIGAAGRAATQSANGPLQLIHLAAYDDGMYPATIQADTQNLSIVVENYEGSPEVFAIRDHSGNQVAQIVPDPLSPRGTLQTALTPGVYQVYDELNPTCVATINVVQ